MSMIGMPFSLANSSSCEEVIFTCAQSARVLDMLTSGGVAYETSSGV